MTTAADLAERGFLPRELPPPFNSASFGALVRTGWAPRVPQSSGPVPHNLFRWGSLRRQLSIPNPLPFVALSREIEARWQQLAPLLVLSPWSLSRPTVSTYRAVEPERNQRVLLLARAANRAGARYALHADISRFYHSIYTHTLEWAVHTKQAVKQNRGLPRAQRQALWGSALDDRHRDLQDRQSVGIPVGPDTSLVAAELLLARVDHDVSRRVAQRGSRFVDDYEFCFATLAEAESALAALQECLAEYELALNPTKTVIRDLPASLEPTWARLLRRVSVRMKGSGQRFDFVDLFDTAFELLSAHREAHVLRFAMGIARHAECLPTNWPLFQTLLLQSMTVEPGIIREVLVELIRYETLGRVLDRPRIAEALAVIIARHAPLAHGSEVSWAIWAHIQLGIPIDQIVIAAVEQMADPVVALVALDAQSRGLVTRPINAQAWLPMMTSAELTGNAWLLTYEAAIKNWLPGNPLAGDPDFLAMQRAGVTFYSILPQPQRAPIPIGGGGGGGGYP